MPERYESNKYCVCEACITTQGMCETFIVLEDHLKILAVLLASDSHRITIQISRAEGTPALLTRTCPAVVLAYFSGVIRRELQFQLRRGKRLEKVIFIDKSPWFGDLDILIEWCITGRIDIDGYTDIDGMPLFISDHVVERIWYLAKSLDMPRFANFIMRLVMAKYSWNFLAQPRSPALDIKSAPYKPDGPVYVVQRESDSENPSLLFLFIKGLMKCRSPCSAEVLSGVRKIRDYKRDWTRTFTSGKLQTESIGLTLSRSDWDAGVLPTRPRNAFKYFVDLSVNKKTAAEFLNQLRNQGYWDFTDPETVSRPVQVPRDLLWKYEEPFREDDFYQYGPDFPESYNVDPFIEADNLSATP
ncbi:hypothetical protein F4810DRAFT_652811 [Camillea tinctor]|nr:hypothetical protein F4810DRAFT_652811 [Camillea tinctor]